MTDNIPPKPSSLINAMERHRESPRSFQIPSCDEALAMTAGDHVKIGLILPEGTNAVFRGAPVDAERFWVKIEGFRIENEEITYFGTVANDLEFVPNFEFGSRISFGPEHVLQILPAPHHTPH
jgi:hypothetical protein